VIHIDRDSVPEPASLSAKLAGSKWYKGLTEAERVAEEVRRHVAAHQQANLPGDALLTFKFDYSKYRETPVKRALETLFHGKCAYCESRYAGTQPLDVEHWRPKAEVHERAADGSRVVLGGYYWLASTWTNLLPSCTDCNRPRSQRDVVTGAEETLGKANQFPVTGERLRPPDPAAPTVQSEQSLLLDPCVHEPAEHLEFHDDGTVRPRGGSPIGAESIRVYALNRSELAFDRLGVARLIEQRLRTIEGLANVLGEPDLPADVKVDLEDLLAHEFDSLFAMAEPDRPYSAMARELILANLPP